MSRPGSTVFVALVAFTVMAVALALRPTLTRTEVLPPVGLPDPGGDPAAAVVVAMRQSGGFSLLGLAFSEQTHTITIQFYAPGGCYEQLTSGDKWPVQLEQCASGVAVEGIVSGSGVTATGESIVAVDVVVTEACFESLGIQVQFRTRKTDLLHDKLT